MSYERPAASSSLMAHPAWLIPNPFCLYSPRGQTIAVRDLSLMEESPNTAGHGGG